jgi:acyltransferase-like protein
MVAGAPGSASVPAPAGYGSAVEHWAAQRRYYLDNLKVVAIAAIIALHAVVGYSQAGWWSYADVREVTISPVTEIAMFFVIGPFGLFLIPLLFTVAGLLTPPSLERKGVARFARDRLLRLGAPFVVYTLVVQPTLLYALYRPLGAARGSYWDEFLGEEEQLDAGPLWFVGVLLIFTLAYAGWRTVGPDRPPRPVPGEITTRRLVIVAAIVAPLTFAVRLVYPLGGDSGFTDLNLWEWPACIAMFGLGVLAHRRGWLIAVPDALHRQSRTAVLATAAGLVAFFAIVVTLGIDDEQLWGGPYWPALAFASLESVLTVFGPVWLLGVAQRHLNRPLRRGAVLARSAYGAFMVQTPVLIGLAVAMRPMPVPAEAKALIVAAGGVAGSFLLAWQLISRVPIVARIL